MIFRLDRSLIFPPAELAEKSGLLAVGGDLHPDRLILAYRSGIFPWYNEDQPILWHSPDPRTVLVPSALYVGRSLQKTLRRGTFEIRLDTSFREVMIACGETPRPNQDGTWITRAMLRAYVKLHERGVAHSAEAWQDGALVGGLYGVAIGGAFFGESMFARVDDASKAAFVTLVQQLQRWGFDLVDCQVHTHHLERFGAVAWSRSRYLAALEHSLTLPGRPGPWTLDAAATDEAP
ncbi:MAG: leucyl/phenylalanyl-tRNA--protein transferase [Minicystis sp.]